MPANWSGMGCYKTTSALWLAERLECKNILVITSKTGKVPYMIAAPKSVPKYRIKNVEIGDDILPASDPTLFFAHYSVFSAALRKSNFSPEQWRKIQKLKGKQKKKYRTLNDTAKSILKIKWDMVICSEAHKIKNRHTSWTETIKRIKTTYKHAETGTMFINSPDEAWSILNWLYNTS